MAGKNRFDDPSSMGNKGASEFEWTLELAWGPGLTAMESVKMIATLEVSTGTVARPRSFVEPQVLVLVLVIVIVTVTVTVTVRRIRP